MKQKNVNRVALLLHWAGEQKAWLFLAVFLSAAGGLCIVVPYMGIYQLMDAAFSGTCTTELVVRIAAMIAVAVVLRFVLFGGSGVAAHKGAYGALFKVRCMVAEHMARVPLGALNERRTGDIKTVLNEDIEKLELFLAHNLPDLVCYLVGPVVVFIYLMTVNVPLALVSLVPLVLAAAVMGVMFRNTDDLMDRANRSISTLNSVMIEYINGMKLIKAYNMGSESFQKFSDAIREENAMWNETSRRMGPPYAAFVVIIECGMLLIVPLGGMFFLRGSLTASAFLLFLYVGSLYLTEIRPLQELGTNFANVLGAVTKAKEILDIPVYQGGSDFPESHDIELRNVRFSYDDKTDVLQGVNLKIQDGERMALVGKSGAGKSTLLSLLAGLDAPSRGVVRFEGEDIAASGYAKHRREHVSLVFQDHNLIDYLTPEENLRLVSAKADMKILEELGLSREESKRNIMHLSGGQRQRVAVGRALVAPGRAILADEPTGSLDPEMTDEVIHLLQHAAHQLGKCVIVVTHSKRVANSADVVLRLRSKKLTRA